mgnify:CR=1 FL=1
MSRIAVIGSGISGLSAALHLSAPGSGHEVTVFEAGQHFGGHANTVRVAGAGGETAAAPSVWTRAFWSTTSAPSPS